MAELGASKGSGAQEVGAPGQKDTAGPAAEVNASDLEAVLNAVEGTFAALVSRGCLYLPSEHFAWRRSVGRRIPGSTGRLDIAITIPRAVRLRFLWDPHERPDRLSLELKPIWLPFRWSTYHKDVPLGNEGARIAPIPLLGALYVISSVLNLLAATASQAVRVPLVGALTFSRLFRSALRAVPPVLVAIVLLFVTSDAWHMLAQPFNARFWALFGLFMLFAGALAAQTAGGAKVMDLIGTSMAAAPLKVSKHNPARPLWSTMRSQANVRCASSSDIWYLRLVLVAASVLQVAAVGLYVAASLVVVGMIGIDKSLATQLVGSPHVVWSYGGLIFLTRELIDISIILGAFAALYYAAVGLGDKDGREEFLHAGVQTLRRTSDMLLLYRVGRAEVERILDRLSHPRPSPDGTSEARAAIRTSPNESEPGPNDPGHEGTAA